MTLTEPEQAEFRRLLIRVRKAVTDIESIPNDGFHRDPFREILQGFYDQTKDFIDKNPEFQKEFSYLSSDMAHKNPGTFEASLKGLRGFLDSVEDTMTLTTTVSPPKEFIIMPGQAFTASKVIESILVSSTTDLKIVDNYMSEDSVQVLETTNRNRDIKILTKKADPKFVAAATQSKKGWKGLYEVRTTSTFHDRYLIVDSRDVWMCGPSIDYLGVKTPGVIVRIEDSKVSSVIVGLFNSEWQTATTVI